MRRLLVLVLGSLLVATEALAQKPQMAVMPLAAKRVSPQAVEILNGVLTAEMDKSGQYTVLGVDEINAMLGLERMKDAVGCDDTSCAAELGMALGAQYLTTGSVGILGDELLVQLTLIDVKSAAVVRRGRGVVKNDEKLYRQAVEQASREVLGLPTTVVSASSGAKRSPARFRFDTTEREFSFDVEVMSMDGVTHKCESPVRPSSSCVLNDLAAGEARLVVASGKLTPFNDTFTVRDSDELYAIELQKRASPGSVISWTFGGISLAAGAALIGTGIPLDKSGMVYGGIPAALVGAGLLVLGAFFDGYVDVNYPGIDAWF